mmetsp:Transcript_28788/g.67372  ORF Transcript_28788/g.67372 Transcript_28788/m.67372 type:complete len:96 (+) Transcript_28788:994-1281(+)
MMPIDTINRKQRRAVSRQQLLKNLPIKRYFSLLRNCYQDLIAPRPLQGILYQGHFMIQINAHFLILVIYKSRQPLRIDDIHATPTQASLSVVASF